MKIDGDTLLYIGSAPFILIVLFVYTSRLFTSTMFFYGKTLLTPSSSKPNKPRSAFSRIYTHLSNLSVPKAYFSHFYIFSTLWTLYLFSSYVSTLFSLSTLPSFFSELLDNYVHIPASTLHLRSVKVLEALLWYTMLTTHVSKRLLECVFVMNSNPKAKLPMLMYIGGLAYYVFVPMMVAINSLESLKDAREGFKNSKVGLREYFIENILVDVKLHHFLAVLLFLWATTEQFHAHSQLSLLRPRFKPTSQQPSTSVSSYRLPTGRYFDLVACPHYLFEMLVYTSFVLVTSGKSLAAWSYLFWVVLGMSSVADDNYKWYKEKFREKVPKGWKRVFPFVY
ncbi:Steroid 5 alpha-reductase 3 [Chytridiales sp. JEL 0842]|nr:Steroid 5 alpha-reductase 3 [Chytridiales sp. JEL 0842]